MDLEKEKIIIKKNISDLKIKLKETKSFIQKRTEELEQQLYLIKRKQKVESMMSGNRRKKSEILGIQTHGSIETGISKMRGRKPINSQAARAIDLPTKKNKN